MAPKCLLQRIANDSLKISQNLLATNFKGKGQIFVDVIILFQLSMANTDNWNWMVTTFFIFTDIKCTSTTWPNWWHHQSWLFVKGYFSFKTYLDSELFWAFRQAPKTWFSYSMRQDSLSVNPFCNLLAWIRARSSKNEK